MRPKNYKVKNGVSNNTLNLIKAVDKKLNQQSFKVQGDTYRSQNWQQIMDSLESIQSAYITFYNNNLNINLRIVTSPLLLSLQDLYITYNKIQSIESLVNMKAPNLQSLSLLTNNITNIKSLRKAYFPRLKLLNISNNPINDPSSLYELVSKQLTQIHIEVWQNLRNIGQRKNWVMKFYPYRLQSLTLKNKSRVKQQQVERIIKSKFPKLLQN